MRADRIAAFVLFVAAVSYVRMAREFHGRTVADVLGPAAYPYIIGGLMALLSILLFLQSKPRPADGRFWATHGRALVLAGSLYLYIRLLDPLGFLLSTFAYITAGHVWLGERSWLKACGLAAALTVILWYVFHRLFDLNLPSGFLGWPQ